MGAMTYRLLSLFALLTLVACKRNEVTSVLLSETDVVLSVGETVQLAAQVEATKDAAEFLPAWRSEDEAVATVTSGGLVTAVADGQALDIQQVPANVARIDLGFFLASGRQADIRLTPQFTDPQWHDWWLVDLRSGQRQRLTTATVTLNGVTNGTGQYALMK